MTENLPPMQRLLEERRQVRAIAAAEARSQHQQEVIDALHRKLRLPSGYYLTDDKTHVASQGERDMIRNELIMAGIIEADALSSKDKLIERVLERMYNRMVRGLPPVDWGGREAKGKAGDGKLRKGC